MAHACLYKILKSKMLLKDASKFLSHNSIEQFMRKVFLI